MPFTRTVEHTRDGRVVPVLTAIYGVPVLAPGTRKETK